MNPRTWFWTVIALSMWTHALPVQAAAEGARFYFREPQSVAYRVETSAAALQASDARPRWLRAWPENGSTNAIYLGSRVVLRVSSPSLVDSLLSGHPLRVDRTLASNLFILQASDALTAAGEAQRLAASPAVEVAHPVRRQPLRRHGPYSPRPNDPYFPLQWHLENRDTNTGAPLGPDLNVRAAWPFSRGAGVTIAICDDGVELDHPDLAPNVQPANHFNFVTGASNGLPLSDAQAHATAVAGLAAAAGGNHRGVAGVAPAATLVSLVIFDEGDFLVDEEKRMDMFEFRSDLISVQNHSWGNADVPQLALGALEDHGIGNAVSQGRQGHGVVLVRSAGNNRAAGNDGNDDGYAQDPRVIAVGAVRQSGRATGYSTPGANVLVAAFSGEGKVELSSTVTTNYLNLCTTDRQGARGYNSSLTDTDEADYGFGATGFNGTSGAAPQIAGLCALILAANPNLNYRDVQQILVLSARQLDAHDPGLESNGAGFLVSHSTGFGVPDAGRAVRLAMNWQNRPLRSSVSVTNQTPAVIPDDGLRVILSGTNVPPALQSIPAFPSDGLHPDDPTASLPLADLGLALQPVGQDLTGRAALIRRGTNYFVEKIAHAADAGARFVIIYNNRDSDTREFMNGADIQFSPIPAVFISQNSGEPLQTYLAQHPEAQAQLRLEAARFSLEVTNTLLCEHVWVRARFSHPRRADVRLTLVSPAGTRSVLQHFNQDTNSGLGNWTYYSTHHFFESSAGVWRVEVSDERPGMTGRVLSLALTITGVAIKDSDHDGLDDDWEMARLGTLAFGPKDDLDGDGWNNMQEQILGTDPRKTDVLFQLDLSRWDARLARLSWPSATNATYAVRTGVDPGAPLTLITNLPGQFPETEWFIPTTNRAPWFFRVEALP